MFLLAFLSRYISSSVERMVLGLYVVAESCLDNQAK